MTEVVQIWYANFANVEQEVLFELILAANYMDIKPLLDLTCATVASMIKGKTPEEIRKTFNIVNDFTPEEEAQVREENKWCEEAWDYFDNNKGGVKFMHTISIYWYRVLRMRRKCK